MLVRPSASSRLRPEPFAPGLRWNGTAQRYIRPSGRFVSPTMVRRAVDAVIVSVKARMPDLASDLVTGRLTLAEWQVKMARELKLLHLAQGAAARGGFAQLTPSDFGRIGQRLQQEYGYLIKFALAIEKRKQPLDGRLINRMQQYVESSRRTYEEVKRWSALAGGILTHEYNRLGPADHCVDCLAATAMGVRPIGEISTPGARRCQGKCHCSLVQVRADGRR